MPAIMSPTRKQLRLDNRIGDYVKFKAKCELARRNFYDFCIAKNEWFYKNRDYLKEICDSIQKFENDDNELLIINAPPRFGKSFTATNATQWLLGRNPKYKIMTCSYNETLSMKFSKQVRNGIQESYVNHNFQHITFRDVFPKTKIKKGSSAVQMWTINGNSEENYLATSPNATTTGIGADFIIIDDIVKNKYEACNADILEKHWEWFTDTLYSRLEGKRKIIVIMTRWAPILDNTPVLTMNGWKNHGDLQIGDCVFGIDGKPVEIKGITEPVWCDMVAKTKEENIICSSNHIWAVKSRKEHNPVEVTAQKLSVIKTPRRLPSINAIEYPDIQSLPIDPYWLGLWLGDGDSYSPQIRCGKKYTKHCETTVYNYKVREADENLFYSYTHQEIRKYLVELNLLGNKHIPSVYKKSSIENRLKLLAGLIDSDGDKRESSYRFTNKNIKLYNDVKELVISLGFNVGSDEIVNKKDSIGINGHKRTGNCYRFCFRPNIEIPVHVEYKKLKPKKSFDRTITIEHSDIQGWGRCISTTAKDGLYLVGKTLIPTHNTKDLAGRLIKMFEKQNRKYKLITFKACDNGKMLNNDILNKEQYKNLIQTIGEDIVRANYDQEPIDLKGVLYENLQEYDFSEMEQEEIPKFNKILSKCDTADTGEDYLCNIIYGETTDKKRYVLDVYYTQDSMEITEEEVAKRLTQYRVQYYYPESNNGGRGFSRSVERRCRELGNNFTIFKPYTQTLNKKARILSNATTVQLSVLFPKDWDKLYPEFYRAVTEYQRTGKNAHDDAPDCLTSLVESNFKSGSIKFA